MFNEQLVGCDQHHEEETGMLRVSTPAIGSIWLSVPTPTFYSYIFENEAVRSEKRTGLNTTPMVPSIILRAYPERPSYD